MHAHETPEHRSIHQLLHEHAMAVRLDVLQSRRERLAARVADVEQELEDLRWQASIAETELDDFTNTYPDLRPWQQVAAEITQRSTDS